MGPVPRDQMRASNADREAVVQRLNAAFGEGRLEVAELDERVATAYAAKTLGDLDGLTDDLPGGTGSPTGPAAAKIQHNPPPWQQQPGTGRPATASDLKQAALDLVTQRLNAKVERDRAQQLRMQARMERHNARLQRRSHHGALDPWHGPAPVAAWAGVSVLCLVIWLVSGMGYPWFLWVAGPWGVMVLMRVLTDKANRSR